MSHMPKHEQPFRLLMPSALPAQTQTPQWVLTSPHSGHLYPKEFISASRLSAHDLRRSEDAHIDRLLEHTPQHGVAVMAAIYPRAYLDLNRAAYELDPTMFDGPLPDYVETDGPRVKSGLGTIARIVADRMPIYRAPLTFDDADSRIQEIHIPFHAKLLDLLEQAIATHGNAFLLDIHSMPSKALYTWAARKNNKSDLPDIILGDRFGSSCDSSLIFAIERYLSQCGYKVARNAPYAGGYITQTYGLASKDVSNVQALQIEISRSLYMDEETYLCHEGYTKLQDDLTGLMAHLTASITKLPRAAE